MSEKDNQTFSKRSLVFNFFQKIQGKVTLYTLLKLYQKYRKTHLQL